jgi:hypothetical protein
LKYRTRNISIPRPTVVIFIRTEFLNQNYPNKLFIMLAIEPAFWLSENVFEKELELLEEAPLLYPRTL